MDGGYFLCAPWGFPIEESRVSLDRVNADDVLELGNLKLRRKEAAQFRARFEPAGLPFHSLPHWTFGRPSVSTWHLCAALHALASDATLRNCRLLAEPRFHEMRCYLDVYPDEEIRCYGRVIEVRNVGMDSDRKTVIIQWSGNNVQDQPVVTIQVEYVLGRFTADAA